jgi:hypothetical protein
MFLKLDLSGLTIWTHVNHPKLARLRALEDAIGIGRHAPKIIKPVISVGQQATEFSHETERIDGRDAASISLASLANRVMMPVPSLLISADDSAGMPDGGSGHAAASD